MPDGDPNTPGQEPTATTTIEAAPVAGSRSLDSFPEEAQDYIRRLRQEAAQYRNELKDVRGNLKKFEDEGKTEAQKLADAAAAAERQATESTAKLLRYEVAAEKGLPLRLAGRLQGSTKQELEVDAENLIKEFGIEGESAGEPAGRSGFDGGVRRPVSRPKSMNGLIRQAAGR
jgi:Skp family chaperone for outer membrane proteins